MDIFSFCTFLNIVQPFRNSMINFFHVLLNTLPFSEELKCELKNILFTRQDLLQDQARGFTFLGSYKEVSKNVKRLLDTGSFCHDFNMESGDSSVNNYFRVYFTCYKYIQFHLSKNELYIWIRETQHVTNSTQRNSLFGFPCCGTRYSKI